MPACIIAAVTANTFMLVCLLMIGAMAFVAWVTPSARNALIKGALILYGIPTPEGDHPTGRRISALRSKVSGAVLAAIGLVTAYSLIWRPIENAKQHSGELHQGIVTLCLPAVLLYGGILQLALDLRDEKSLRIGDDGRLKFTRRARVVELGVLFAVAAWCVGWYLYVRSRGFDAYLGDIPLPQGR